MTACVGEHTRTLELHLAYELGLELADFQLDGNQAFQPAVVEEQVNEILLVVHLQPELAADEGEQTAHSTKKILDSGNKGPLQFPLAVCLAHLQKAMPLQSHGRKMSPVFLI